MRNGSKITSDLAVDPPLVQNAGFEFGRDDRQRLDNQIRGVQEHLVAALIRGRHATYLRVDASGPALAPGDNVCLALEQAEPRVTKCTASALTDAVAVFGVVVLAAAPGAFALIAFGGVLPPSITGLAPSAPGFVRVDPAGGRCERVAALGSGDYGIGVVSRSGNMMVVPGIGAGSTLAFALPSADEDDVWGSDGAGGFKNLGPMSGGPPGPKGDKGDPGDVGPKGDTGDAGADLQAPPGDADDVVGLDGAGGLKSLGPGAEVPSGAENDAVGLDDSGGLKSLGKLSKFVNAVDVDMQDFGAPMAGGADFVYEVTPTQIRDRCCLRVTNQTELEQLEGVYLLQLPTPAAMGVSAYPLIVEVGASNVGLAIATVNPDPFPEGLNAMVVLDGEADKYRTLCIVHAEGVFDLGGKASVP